MNYHVVLQLVVRKFFCDHLSYTQWIFTERLQGFLQPYTRRTTRVEEQLKYPAFSTSAEQGARLAKIFYLPVSAATSLPLIRKVPIHPTLTTSVMGIDDCFF
jgi:hypothetical protein